MFVRFFYANTSIPLRHSVVKLVQSLSAARNCNLKIHNALRIIFRDEIVPQKRWLTVSPPELWRARAFVIIGLRCNPPEWRYRLGVRTEDSQSSNTGSIPVSATKVNRKGVLLELEIIAEQSMVAHDITVPLRRKDPDLVHITTT